MKKLGLAHLLLLLWIAVLIFRYELFYHISQLVLSVVSGEINILKINPRFYDYLVSFLLFFVLPVAVWKIPALKNIFQKRLTWLNAFLSLFFVIILFAPLLSTSNPDLHYNIKKCKLLPPFSEVFIESSVGENAPADSDLYNYFKSEIINRGISKGAEYYNDGNANEGRRVIFIFGTDEYARDVYSRILYGTRFAFLLGLGSVTLSFLIAFVLGLAAGFGGKFWDNLINRFTEIFLSFPFLFLIIVFLAFFGNSFWVVVLVLGLSGWMGLFKIIRGEILRLKSKDFILSAKMLGIPEYKILLKEILPIILSPLLVNLVLQFGNVIMAESALSFLGFGAGEEYFSWGSMINSGQYYLSTAWWLSFFPSLFLAVSLLTMNRLGNTLEKVFNPESTK